MKTITLLILTFTLLLSAPALNKTKEFKNSDGTTFKAKSVGNHHLNWIETEDGEVLKYNSKSKNYEYGEIKNSALKASGAKYEKENSKRARSRGHINKINKDELYNLWTKKRKEAHERKHRKPKNSTQSYR